MNLFPRGLPLNRQAYGITILRQSFLYRISRLGNVFLVQLGEIVPEAKRSGRFKEGLANDAVSQC
jgi:hypothetical protein